MMVLIQLFRNEDNYTDQQNQKIKACQKETSIRLPLMRFNYDEKGDKRDEISQLRGAVPC